MIKFIKNITSRPVFADNDDRTGIAAILNAIIINISFILVIAAIASIFLFARPLYSLAMVGALSLLVAASRFLMMKGRVRYGSLVLLAGLWLVITALVLFAGGMRSIDAVYFLVITVFAGLLLGTRGAVFFALLSAAAGAVMMTLELRDVPLPVYFPVPVWAGWINLCLALQLIGSSLALAQKSITNSLSEARRELTGRITSEEALRKSEARANALLDAMPDIMFQLDSDLKILDYRTGKNELYVGPDVEIRGESLGRFLSRDLFDKIRVSVGNTLATGEIQVFEYELDMPRKGMRFYESRMVKSGDGEVIAIIRDITERILSERRIRDSLSEKEVLLKEIHHRVKNNLQVISSLISLQAEQHGGGERGDVFIEIKNRVRTMALVHESLYRSESLSRINLREYITSLKNNIQNSYLTGAEGILISCRVGDIFIDIDRAIPVGLIINELMTNALKYAFPGGRKGEIILECAREDDTYRLTVSDNGIGLPPHVDVSTGSSLGLKIVNALASQLRGSLTVSRDGGTTMRVVFS